MIEEVPEVEQEFGERCSKMSFMELAEYTENCLENLQNENLNNLSIPRNEATYNEILRLLFSKIGEGLDLHASVADEIGAIDVEHAELLRYLNQIKEELVEIKREKFRDPYFFRSIIKIDNIVGKVKDDPLTENLAIRYIYNVDLMRRHVTEENFNEWSEFLEDLLS